MQFNISNKIGKLSILIFGLFCSFSSVNAQEKISLDEDWKFHFGNASNPDKDFDYSKTALLHKSNVYATTIVNPKFVDTTWKKINVHTIGLSNFLL